MTRSVLAYEWHGDMFVDASAGNDAMFVRIPCVVSGDFALMYNNNNPPPDEWLNTFISMY